MLKITGPSLGSNYTAFTAYFDGKTNEGEITVSNSEDTYQIARKTPYF